MRVNQLKIIQIGSRRSKLEILVKKEVIEECIWMLMRPTGVTNDDLSIVKDMLTNVLSPDEDSIPVYSYDEKTKTTYCFDDEVDPKNIDNNKHYILEILDLLIKNEKRKVVGLGANISSILGGELEEMRERILGR